MSTKCLSDVGLVYSYGFVFFLHAVWFYKHHSYLFLQLKTDRKWIGQCIVRFISDQSLVVFNTQYATYSFFVFVLKMEYGWNFFLKVLFSIVIINTRKIFFWNPSMWKFVCRPIDLLHKCVVLVQKYEFHNLLLGIYN